MADCDVPVVRIRARVVDASANCTQRWHNRCLIATYCSTASMGLGHSLSNCHILLHCGATLELLELIQYVATIIARLAHAFVKVIKCRVRHLQSFV